MNSRSTGTEPTFEEAYQRIEEIARELEGEDSPLEKSFALYEEGQKLLTLCNRLLDNAEKRLKVLQKGSTGFEVKDEIIE